MYIYNINIWCSLVFSKKYIISPLLFGMVLGTIWFLFQFKNIDVYYNAMQFCKLKVNGFNNNHLILYIIKQRVVEMVILMIISFLFSYKIALLSANFIFGIYYGVSSCILFSQYGLVSYKLLIGMFFPHCVIYFICSYYIGKYLIYNNNKINNLNYFVKILFIIIFMLLGVLGEIFFQKNIVDFYSIYCIDNLC